MGSKRQSVTYVASNLGAVGGGCVGDHGRGERVNGARWRAIYGGGGRLPIIVLYAVYQFPILTEVSSVALH